MKTCARFSGAFPCKDDDNVPLPLRADCCCSVPTSVLCDRSCPASEDDGDPPCSMWCMDDDTGEEAATDVEGGEWVLESCSGRTGGRRRKNYQISSAQYVTTYVRTYVRTYTRPCSCCSLTACPNYRQRPCHGGRRRGRIPGVVVRTSDLRGSRRRGRRGALRPLVRHECDEVGEIVVRRRRRRRVHVCRVRRVVRMMRMAAHRVPVDLLHRLVVVRRRGWRQLGGQAWNSGKK